MCNLETISEGINTPIFRITCSFTKTLRAGYAISVLDPATANVLVGYLSSVRYVHTLDYTYQCYKFKDLFLGRQA